MAAQKKPYARHIWTFVKTENLHNGRIFFLHACSLPIDSHIKIHYQEVKKHSWKIPLSRRRIKCITKTHHAVYGLILMRALSFYPPSATPLSPPFKHHPTLSLSINGILAVSRHSKQVEKGSGR